MDGDYDPLTDVIMLKYKPKPKFVQSDQLKVSHIFWGCKDALVLLSSQGRVDGCGYGLNTPKHPLPSHKYDDALYIAELV